MKTIRHQLLVWLLTSVMMCVLIAGATLFLKIRKESSELFDAQLKQIANNIPVPLSFEAIDNDSIEPEDKFVVQVWDDKSQLSYSSDTTISLPLYPKNGFKTVHFNDEQWHIYSRYKQGLTIQVAQPTQVRQELAAKMALRSLFPFLGLIPILAMLIWVIVGRSLKPLQLFTEAVKRRSPGALQALSLDGLSPEVIPACLALNELLENLDHSLKTQRDFIADAAHELRTPLAALKLQLQLAERTDNAIQRQTALEKLHERIDRANHLVHQLLTLARHEPGNEGKGMRYTDLRQLVELTVIDFYPLASHKKIELGLDSDAETFCISGCSDDLRILLNNIVDNAVRYTPEGGTIDLSIKHVANQVVLTVTDTGPGIQEHEKHRVFDRFYRCEENDIWGSGLGLSIVKNIVDQHAANIELNDNQAGHGLVVNIYFNSTPSNGEADHIIEIVNVV